MRKVHSVSITWERYSLTFVRIDRYFGWHGYGVGMKFDVQNDWLTLAEESEINEKTVMYMADILIDQAVDKLTSLTNRKQDFSGLYEHVIGTMKLRFLV